MKTITRVRVTGIYNDAVKCILVDEKMYKNSKDAFPSEVNPMASEVKNQPLAPVLDYEDVK